MGIWAIVIAAVFVVGVFSANPIEAQESGGGVDHPGSWFVGEGLEVGNNFSYELCHVDFKECAAFELRLSVIGETLDTWQIEFHVIDGNNVLVEILDVDKITFEALNPSDDFSQYANAYSNSLAWLSNFANKLEPKEFSLPSWGKIGNIGGQQVSPTSIESISVPAGTFHETVLISWRTGGYTSQIWVLDEFPFPLKASTFTPVSEGIPPLEYQFELLSSNEAPGLPDAPENFVADDVSPTQIILHWDEPDDDGGSPVTGYKLSFRIHPSSTQIVLENFISNTVFDHTSLVTDKIYIYRLWAHNANGISENFIEATATPKDSSSPPQDIVPNPPTGLTATDISPTSIVLSWNKPAANNGPPVDGYKIEFKIASGSFSILVADTASTDRTFTHTSLTTGTTYTYKVYALNSIGPSDSSNEASATPSSPEPSMDIILSDADRKKFENLIEKWEMRSHDLQEKADDLLDKADKKEDKPHKAEKFRKKAGNTIAKSEVLQQLSDFLRQLLNNF